MITILTRKNLIRESEDLPIESIGVVHIRSSLEAVQKSSLVLLAIDDKLTMLKNKFHPHDGVYHSVVLEMFILQHIKQLKDGYEARLKEIETELEVVHQEIEELEENEPPYDRENPGASFDKYREHMEPGWSKERKLNREKRMLMTPEFKELSTYGDVITLKHWLECVEGGEFIDYDGSGNYVRDGKESNITIKPSDVQHDSIRKDFDTIIWFNR